MNQDSLHRLEIVLEAAGALNARASIRLVDTNKIVVDDVGLVSNNDIIEAVKTTMQREPWAFKEVDESVLGKFVTMDSFFETLSKALSQDAALREAT